MRILIIASDTQTIGGIQRYMQDVMRALRELDISYSVIEFTEGHLFSKTHFALRAIIQAFRYKPDLIFCGHIAFAPICLFLERFGYPYFLFTYGIEVWRNSVRLDAFYKALKIVTISNFTRERIISKDGGLENKIFLLSNAVHQASSASPHLQELRSRYGNKVILSVCRLSREEQYKGYDTLVGVMPAVLREFPEARYVIVGDGDDRPRIEDLIREHLLQGKVDIVGFVSESELNDFYYLPALFALPSKGEGFGFVFLEAIARGTLVLAGNKDGSVDALLRGEAGILVNPEDKEEIKDAILNVFRGIIPEHLRDMEAVKRRVFDAYGFDAFRAKMKELISTI